MNRKLGNIYMEI